LLVQVAPGGARASREARPPGGAPVTVEILTQFATSGGGRRKATAKHSALSRLANTETGARLMRVQQPRSVSRCQIPSGCVMTASIARTAPGWCCTTSAAPAFGS